MTGFWIIIIFIGKYWRRKRPSKTKSKEPLINFSQQMQRWTGGGTEMQTEVQVEAFPWPSFEPHISGNNDRIQAFFFHG
jgi:hypothetical protein